MLDVVIAITAAGWLRSEFLLPEPTSYRWVWTVSIAVYYVWVLARMPGWVRSLRAGQRMLSESVRRLQAMHECYAELKGPVLDPTRVRDTLLAAEGLGVRWSRATWPLLEVAIAREPAPMADDAWMTISGKALADVN